MTLLDLADMLADILQTEDVYAGNIDGNLKSCIGVYNAKNGGVYRIALGGKQCTKTKDKRISILVHHTENPTLCEVRAEEILNVLTDIRNYETENATVKYISPNEPVSVGRDDRGICEYVIQAQVYYENRKE